MFCVHKPFLTRSDAALLNRCVIFQSSKRWKISKRCKKSSHEKSCNDRCWWQRGRSAGDSCSSQVRRLRILRCRLLVSSESWCSWPNSTPIGSRLKVRKFSGNKCPFRLSQDRLKTCFLNQKITSWSNKERSHEVTSLCFVFLRIAYLCSSSNGSRPWVAFSCWKTKAFT